MINIRSQISKDAAASIAFTARKVQHTRAEVIRWILEKACSDISPNRLADGMAADQYQANAGIHVEITGVIEEDE